MNRVRVGKAGKSRKRGQGWMDGWMDDGWMYRTITKDILW